MQEMQEPSILVQDPATPEDVRPDHTPDPSTSTTPKKNQDPPKSILLPPTPTEIQTPSTTNTLTPSSPIVDDGETPDPSTTPTPPNLPDENDEIRDMETEIYGPTEGGEGEKSLI